MITLYMLRRAKPEAVARLARSLKLHVADNENHRMLCMRVIVAMERGR
jgi:hypothetical protein